MRVEPYQRKADDTFREALAKVLITDVSDPRLQQVTVGAVEVSRDRSVAKAFIITNQDHADDVRAGLQSAKGRIRSLLSQNLGWRYTPEIRFEIDTTLDNADQIYKALRNVPPTLQVPKDEDGYPLPSD